VIFVLVCCRAECGVDPRLAGVGPQGACGCGPYCRAGVVLEPVEQGRHGAGIAAGDCADVRDRSGAYVLIGIAESGEQVVALAGAAQASRYRE
jgi:hypothetical protein